MFATGSVAFRIRNGWDPLPPECAGKRRRPWRDPGELEGYVVRQLARIGHTGKLMYPKVFSGSGTRPFEHGHLVRNQVMTLWAAGAVYLWREPGRGRYCSFTPEAFSHPDVVELIWTRT